MAMEATYGPMDKVSVLRTPSFLGDCPEISEPSRLCRVALTTSSREAWEPEGGQNVPPMLLRLSVDVPYL